MLSSYRHLTFPLLVIAALGGAFFFAVPAAEACMVFSCSDCCEGCEMCYCDSGDGYCNCSGYGEALMDRSDVEVVFTTPRTVSVILPTYSTTHLQPATQCVTALSPVSGVQSVDAVVNFDGRTGLPFQEVTFFRSHGPGDAIAKLAAETGAIDRQGEAWYAFQSHITGTVRDGVPNYFVVSLTLEPGVTKQKFLRALRKEGLFLTSSSDASGVPTSHHSTFRRVGENEIRVTDARGEAPRRPATGRP